MLALKMIWLVTIPGLLATLLTFREVVLDLRYLRASGMNGVMLRLAKTIVRRETVRVIKHVLLLYALIVTYPYVDRYAADPDFTRTFLVKNGILILTANLISLNSVLDLLSRRKNLPQLVERQP